MPSDVGKTRRDVAGGSRWKEDQVAPYGGYLWLDGRGYLSSARSGEFKVEASRAGGRRSLVLDSCPDSRPSLTRVHAESVSRYYIICVRIVLP